MHYNVTSKYVNKTKVRYSDENAPFIDHEIVETYKGVDETQLKATLSTLMDVMDGIPEPTFTSKSGHVAEIPENIKNEICESYKKRYSKFSELCKELESFSADSSRSEINVELGEDFHAENAFEKPSGETITVTKAE